MTNSIQSFSVPLNPYTKVQRKPVTVNDQPEQRQAPVQTDAGGQQQGSQARLERQRRVQGQNEAETVLYQPYSPQDLPRRNQQALAAYRSTAANTSAADAAQVVGLDLYA